MTRAAANGCVALFCGASGAIVPLAARAVAMNEVSAQEQASGDPQLTKATSSRVFDVLLANIILDGPWVSLCILVADGAHLGRGSRVLITGLLKQPHLVGRDLRGPPAREYPGSTSPPGYASRL